MITGFKKDDRVVHPNVPQVLRISSISGAFAILRTDGEGYSVGQFPLSELQLASGPKATAVRAGDIVMHAGEEARVDRVNNCKLWVEDSRRVHIVDRYQVRRAPIDVGNWVRVCETGLVGMVTSRDPSYVRAFEVAGEAYHERELVRTTEPGIRLTREEVVSKVFGAFLNDAKVVARVLVDGKRVDVPARVPREKLATLFSSQGECVLTIDASWRETETGQQFIPGKSTILDVAELRPIAREKIPERATDSGPFADAIEFWGLQ